jgi:hypothetical protein
MILLVSAASVAAEFRGVELGSSCADINQVEDELGSSPIPVRSRGGGEYRFSGQAYGHPIEIVYLCENDTLAIGSYLFRSAQFDSAAEYFRAAYGDLSAKLGATRFEYPGYPDAADSQFPHPGMQSPTSYTASWEGPDFSAHLSLTRGPNAPWQVVFGIHHARSN